MGETKFTFYNHILSGNKLWTFTFGLLNFLEEWPCGFKINGWFQGCLSFFFFSCVGTKAPPAAKMSWLTVFRPSVVKQMSTETFADLMIKSKLSACGGSTAMRQLSPIY